MSANTGKFGLLLLLCVLFYGCGPVNYFDETRFTAPSDEQAEELAMKVQEDFDNGCVDTAIAAFDNEAYFFS